MNHWLGGALLVILAATLSGCGPARARGHTVTIQSLLEEMTDRDAIARIPDPNYTARHVSSYDRAQTDPANPATWHANHDFEQFIRVEQHDGRREWVIMEHQGPGCITHIWTPLWEPRKDQIIRFYLDGSSTPAIAVNFMKLMSGRLFAAPPFAFVAWDAPRASDQRGVGGDLYLPIPFARSCKITLDELPFYYAVDYRAYFPGTPVESFSLTRFQSARGAIERASKALMIEHAPRGARTFKATIPSGGHYTHLLPRGAAALRSIQIRLGGSVSPEALRSTILVMLADGEQTVWCPVGEFFGCGVRLRPVSDRFRSVTADGILTARWVMPYHHSAQISIFNLGRSSVALTLSAGAGAWYWDDRSMLFHATWRGEFPLATRPMSDWNYLTARGHGVYVGDTLTVMNPDPAWYGEGDERIYVDDEPFPSFLGTGTEDYYGYAWGMANGFSSPFMAMPARDGTDRGDWTGYTTTSRIRLLDQIPFTRSLRFDMEVWHWADTRVGYSAATFWYARPGAASNRGPMRAAAAQALPEPPGPLNIAGAIECEKLPIMARSTGIPIDVQTLNPRLWSGGAQLFVRARTVGDYVEIAIPATGADPLKLTLFATHSYDYGILRFTVNGERAPKDLDTYSPNADPPSPVDLGECRPDAGQIRLRVEVVGANPASGGKYFGLDCVTLDRL